MTKSTEIKPEGKLTREQMLGHITASGIQIADIRGCCPGTGPNPDISQLSDELLKVVYNMVRYVGKLEPKIPPAVE